MELNPLSFPHVVIIVESLSVVNNVYTNAISSFRINNVNVCETSLSSAYLVSLINVSVKKVLHEYDNFDSGLFVRL